MKPICFIAVLFACFRLSAHMHSLELDSVAARVEQKLDAFGKEIFELRAKGKLSVYSTPSNIHALTDEELIDQMDSNALSSPLQSFESYFNQAKYTLITQKTGRSGNKRIEYIRLQYPKAAFWINAKELKLAMDKEKYAFFLLIFQNKFGFEAMVATGGNYQPDYTIYIDTIHFKIDYLYKVHLEIYFLSDLNQALEKYYHSNEQTGLYLDSLFQEELVRVEDHFSKPIPKKTSNNKSYIVEVINDPELTAISLADYCLKIKILNPYLTQEKAIAKKDFLIVYVPLAQMKYHLSPICEEWLKGLYGIFF